MSEQTPTSTEDLNGAEPSMEDILASIRKIISEDEPVAMESPEDVQPVEIVAAQSPILTSEPLASFGDGATDLAEGDSVDLNIDDVLAGLDDDLGASDGFTPEELEIPEIPADATEDFSIESLMPVQETPDLSSAAAPDLSAPDLAAPELDADTAFENDDDVFAFLDKAVVEETAEPIADIEATHVISDLMEVVEAPSTVPEAVEDVMSETEIVSDDVEMDALLDDILLAPEEAVDEIAAETAEEFVPEEAVEDEIEEDVVEDYMSEPEVLSEAEQSDLDLVKSLMAELADDPSYEAGDDLDELLDIEETADFSETTDAALDNMPDEAALDGLALEDLESEPEEDILGDILDMSLEDELQSQPDDISDDFDLGDLASLDDVAAAEQENILENILEDLSGEGAADDVGTELPSLAEIAAAAQADAVAVETSAALSPVASSAGLAAAGAGIAALGAKVAAEPDAEIETVAADAGEIETLVNDTPDIEFAEADTSIVNEDNITETKTLPNQETSMPVKAVKTDTIIDEVTETATAGAFAELNQVVEDKAVFNERGPRIGDLVQDALRPMLKEWLDANLKGIVERAVTKEVKRISKGQ